MATLTLNEYAAAVADWSLARSSYPDLQNLISPEKVFTIYPDQISWLNNLEQSESYFRLDVGIWDNQLILILAPISSIFLITDFEFTVLESLTEDLQLNQTKTYTITNKYVLSKDLVKAQDNTDVNFPILDQPVTGQQVAVSEIESWRESGMDWLYLESTDFNGERIFQSFYVPKQDLLQNQEDATSIVCAFGLKPSPVYQRLLPTLIFISCFDSASLIDIATKVPSNTYDWSKPNPPYSASTLGY